MVIDIIEGDRRVPEVARVSLFASLHGRGMTLQKIARTIGNSSHTRVSQALAGVPGRGRDVRRRIANSRVLSDGEMETIGLVCEVQYRAPVGDMGEKV